MSSFSCPHQDSAETFCKRLKTDCVPGRTGCVLTSKKYEFAVPASKRINRLKDEKKSGFETGKRK